MAFGEVIIDRDVMIGVEQFFRANRPDVARAARDKYFHAVKICGFGVSEPSAKL
jgi:hypothetical protein